MAVSMSVVLVAYLALFTVVGLLFVGVNLTIGWFLRPHDPHPEKQEIYECGEPTIGSGFVQFDLRFYTVALLFIIFDVEVAMFFPWAVVFGKATQLDDPDLRPVATALNTVQYTSAAKGLYTELGIREPVLNRPFTGDADAAARRAADEIRAGANKLAWMSIGDIFAFFAVLMVGFAYVWRRGDLDWVRALAQERGRLAERGPPGEEPVEEEPALSA